MKIKVGDNVKVMIGKDKGKTGKVERVYPVRLKVLIAGVNEYKRHLKARSQDMGQQGAGPKSEIVTITKPLPISNVAIVCGKCKKTARIAFKMDKGKKIRICSNCKKEIE